MKRDFHLKQILILSFFAGLVLPAFVIGALLFNFFSSKMEKELINRNMLLAESMAGEVDRFMGEPKKILEHSFSAIVHGIITEREIDPYLQTILNSYDYFESIIITDSKGVIRHSAPYTKDIIGNRIVTDSYRHFLNLGKEEGVFYLSQTYISIYTHQTTLSIAFMKNRQLFNGTLNLMSLQYIIDRTKILEGYAFITDKKGVAIAHPDVTFVNQRINLNNLSIVEQTLNGKPGLYFFDMNGREYVGSSSFCARNSLALFLVQPISSIFGPVIAMRNYGLFGLAAVLILTILMGTFLISRILLPLNQLVAQTRKIAGGDYEIETGESKYEELNVIWDSF